MTVDDTIKIRGSSGLFHTFHRTVAVNRDGLQVVRHSGKAELYPFDKVRIVCCEHWQMRLGLLGPVSQTKLHVQLRDGNGKLIPLEGTNKPKWWQLGGELTEFYVEHFTESDVVKLRDAIKAARPDILVVDKTFESMSAAEEASIMASLKNS